MPLDIVIVDNLSNPQQTISTGGGSMGSVMNQQALFDDRYSRLGHTHVLNEITDLDEFVENLVGGELHLIFDGGGF